MNSTNHTMQASPSLNAQSRADGDAPVRGRLVTDAPLRMFHWLFALSFVGSYLTAESEHWRALHVTLGYSFAMLFGFRVLYGLGGPRQARLGLLWRKLGAAPAWLRSAVTRHPAGGVNWRQGQYLVMALAVALMLALVVPLTLAGYATYNDWGDLLGGDWLEELHEFFANLLLLVVVVHLGGIVLSSLLTRRNQALSMLTGRLPGAGPSPVKHNRAWLAALLLLAVLSFGVWQWQSRPGESLSGSGGSQALSLDAPGRAHVRHDDGDDDD